MQNASLTRLSQALLSMKNSEEMCAFLQDLCTIQELKSLSQRYEVAELLEKKYTYAQIADQTRASTATISRVNHSLVYGAEGYQLALERMKEKKEGK